MTLSSKNSPNRFFSLHFSKQVLVNVSKGKVPARTSLFQFRSKRFLKGAKCICKSGLWGFFWCWWWLFWVFWQSSWLWLWKCRSFWISISLFPFQIFVWCYIEFDSNQIVAELAPHKSQVLRGEAFKSVRVVNCLSLVTDLILAEHIFFKANKIVTDPADNQIAFHIFWDLRKAVHVPVNLGLI